MKKELIKILLIVFYFLPINSFAEIKPISEGSVDAKIKLIVFESLTCGHCGSFHKNVYPKLKEDFIDNKRTYSNDIKEVFTIRSFIIGIFVLKIHHKCFIDFEVFEEIFYR